MNKLVFMMLLLMWSTIFAQQDTLRYKGEQLIKSFSCEEITIFVPVRASQNEKHLLLSFKKKKIKLQLGRLQRVRKLKKYVTEDCWANVTAYLSDYFHLYPS